MVNKTFTMKYRPKFLDEFKLNELHETIRTFININKMVLIFVGNSGAGKTTILHAIVREYYGTDTTMDNDNIMSINTLKDQGIAYYRNDVRIFCQSTSTIPGKKKILILDDLDIINEQGQQVFRNCIDKYKHNVCFIASCTNMQKIIDSIQSRMDIIRIRPHTSIELSEISNNIIVNECISIDNCVVPFIVSVCNGSIRILINYLEKFKLLGKHVDVETASQLCTNISYKDLDIFTTKCISKDILSAMRILNSFVDKGYSVTDILECYFTYLKHTALIEEEIKYKIIPLICKYITIFHNVHEDEIELYFFTNNLISLLSNKIN